MADGRIEEAISTYQQLLGRNPKLAGAWYNLGYLQRCRRHFPEAIDAYRRALSANIERPEEVHLNLAVILSEHMDRMPEAESELLAALHINPEFVPGLLNLGNLQEDQGHSQQARSTYEKVLEIEPLNGRAMSRIAMIEVIEGRTSESVPRLQAALRAGSATMDDLAEIGFALGHVHDALGEYDEAFAAMTSANAARVTATSPSLRYDATSHEHLIEELIAAFQAPSTNGHGRDLREPIFICGMFRSGSTLAESIISSHSRVTAGGELEFMPALVAEKLKPYPQSLLAPSPELIAELRAAYMAELNAIYPCYDVITDKRPDNFLHIGLIKTLFPRAKIVHTFRNPLDNILSIFLGNFDQSISYSNSIADTYHWFVQYRRLIMHWKLLYGDDIFDLDYDELVSNPEKTVRSLINFCGLEWEDGCLDRKAGSETIRTLSAWQVRQPLHSRSSGRWRNYEAHLEEIASKLDGV